jgi:hypothetical protein
MNLMATYLALRKQLWKTAEVHLRVISAFDPGLKFRLIQKSTKTLFDFGLKEITYNPSDLKHEGRKLLHSVINFVGGIQEVLILPLEDSFNYDHPNDVSVIKSTIPWIDKTRTHFYLSEFYGGLMVTRTDPVTGEKVWCVDYDSGESPTYEFRTLDGGWMPADRPEILFHELVHLNIDGDPISASLASGPSPSYVVKEGIAISRTNAFRISRNPRMRASGLRSTSNLEGRRSY